MAATEFLDKQGLAHFVGLVKTALAGKSPTTHKHTEWEEYTVGEEYWTDKLGENEYTPGEFCIKYNRSIGVACVTVYFGFTFYKGENIPDGSVILKPGALPVDVRPKSDVDISLVRSFAAPAGLYENSYTSPTKLKIKTDGSVTWEGMSDAGFATLWVVVFCSSSMYVM